MKIGYVNGVWFHLCLQAETVPFPIHMAIFAFFIILTPQEREMKLHILIV